jgi:membrane protein required for beta-lactamase induction
MAQNTITPSGFAIKNFGDGRTIILSWSVVDLLSVTYFVVEHFNRHKRAWEPYDGFRGIV